MPGLIADLPILFAQAPAAGGAGNQGFSSYVIFLYMGIALLWFYLFMIRPPQQQEKKRQEMLGALQKNDRVITSTGIYGTVLAIEKDRVGLRIDDDKGGKVFFTKASIVQVLNAREDKEKAADPA